MRASGILAIVLFAVGSAQASYVYDFSYTGSNSYNVVFVEPSLITTAGSFAFSPFAINGNTFTQGFFDPRCSAFSFATSDGSADDCGATAGAGAEGFFLQYDSPPTSPGVYSTLEAAGVGINPGNAPDQLTITSLVATPEPSTLCLIGLAACLLTPSICKLRPEGRTGMLNRLQERQGPEDDRLRRWGRAGIFRGEREVEGELGKCDNVGAGRTHGAYVR